MPAESEEKRRRRTLGLRAFDSSFFFTTSACVKVPTFSIHCDLKNSSPCLFARVRTVCCGERMIDSIMQAGLSDDVNRSKQIKCMQGTSIERVLFYLRRVCTDASMRACPFTCSSQSSSYKQRDPEGSNLLQQVITADSLSLMHTH